jgi:hypothetical protein
VRSISVDEFATELPITACFELLPDDPRDVIGAVIRSAFVDELQQDRTEGVVGAKSLYLCTLEVEGSLD